MSCDTSIYYSVSTDRKKWTTQQHTSDLRTSYSEPESLSLSEPDSEPDEESLADKRFGAVSSTNKHMKTKVL
jgi:hypothetical protein